MKFDPETMRFAFSYPADYFGSENPTTDLSTSPPEVATLIRVVEFNSDGTLKTVFKPKEDTFDATQPAENDTEPMQVTYPLEVMLDDGYTIVTQYIYVDVANEAAAADAEDNIRDKNRIGIVEDDDGGGDEDDKQPVDDNRKPSNGDDDGGF